MTPAEGGGREGGEGGREGGREGEREGGQFLTTIPEMENLKTEMVFLSVHSPYGSACAETY